jgi:hypothetical protein
MTQLAANAKIADIIASLTESTGINQKVELADVIGLPALPTDSIATQVAILQSNRQTLITATNLILAM